MPIGIQIWDHDSTSGDDLGDASPLAADPNLDITLNLATGAITGDATTSCSRGDGVDDDDNDYYSLLVCFDVATGSTTGDRDGDGLLDNWERFGLDKDGNGTVDLDLPAFGVNPNRADLFVEYDYEAGRAPSRDGINAMKAAFAAAPRANPDGSSGIRLHADVGFVVDPTADEGGITGTCSNGVDDDGDRTVDAEDTSCVYLDASREVVAPNCGNGIDDDGDGRVDGNDPNCAVGDNLGGGQNVGPAGTVNACNLDTNFYAAKRANFDGTNRGWVFRYHINAVRPPAPCAVSGGWGEVGGNDVVNFNRDAGSFLHELGHNVNLQHGGADGDNCKPNYLSVMNYNLQGGIPWGTTGSILDFSPPRRTLNGSTRSNAPLAPLNETNLNETVAIDATDTVNRTSFVNGSNVVATINVNTLPNWNGDTDPPRESAIAVNIDSGSATVGAPGCANTSQKTLTGANDWTRVSLPFRQFGDSADSAINQQEDLTPTDDQLAEIAASRRRNDLVASLSATPNPVAAGTDLTYTATLTNEGPNPSGTATLTVSLPPETTINAAVAAPCSATGTQTVSCSFGVVAPGDSRSVTVTVAVPSDLVYVAGAPRNITAGASVDDLSADDVDPVDDTTTLATLVVAVADLSVTSITLPSPPIRLPTGQLHVVALNTLITSGGPSSPMDTNVTLTASADSGAWISPAFVVNSHPHLTIGEQRMIGDHVIIRCDTPGRHRFTLQQTIAPADPVDTDPNPGNDSTRIRFTVDCVGQRGVTIDALPGQRSEPAAIPLWRNPSGCHDHHRR